MEAFSDKGKNLFSNDLELAPSSVYRKYLLIDLEWAIQLIYTIQTLKHITNFILQTKSYFQI